MNGVLGETKKHETAEFKIYYQNIYIVIRITSRSSSIIRITSRRWSAEVCLLTQREIPERWCAHRFQHWSFPEECCVMELWLTEQCPQETTLLLSLGKAQPCLQVELSSLSRTPPISASCARARLQERGCILKAGSKPESSGKWAGNSSCSSFSNPSCCCVWTRACPLPPALGTRLLLCIPAAWHCQVLWLLQGLTHIKQNKHFKTINPNEPKINPATTPKPKQELIQDDVWC